MATKPTLVVVGNEKFYKGLTQPNNITAFSGVVYAATLNGVWDSADNPDVLNAEHLCYLFSDSVENDLDPEDGWDLKGVVEDLVNAGEDTVVVIGTAGGVQLAEETGAQVLTSKETPIPKALYRKCGLEWINEEKSPPSAARKKAPPRRRPSSPSSGDTTSQPAQTPEKPNTVTSDTAELEASVTPPKKKLPPKDRKKEVLEDLDLPKPPVARTTQSIIDSDLPTEEPEEAPKPRGGWGNRHTENGPAETTTPPTEEDLAPIQVPSSRGKALAPTGGRWASHRQEALNSNSQTLAPTKTGQWSKAVAASRGVASDRAVRRWGQVCAVAARKGGVGKTSWAINFGEYLGQQLGKENRKVAVVDMNSQQGDIAHYIGTSDPNISLLVQKQHILSDGDSLIDQVMVRSPTDHFDALLAPKNAMESDPRTVNAELYKQAINVLKDYYDVIVVDTPVGERWHAGMEFILKEADYILTPVSSSRTTVQGIRDWLNDITKPEGVPEGLGIPSSKIGVILNKGREHVDMPKSEVQDILTGYKVIAGVPDSDDWLKAENNGKILSANLPPALSGIFASVAYAATGWRRFEELQAQSNRRATKATPAKKPQAGGLLKRIFGVG